MGVFDYLKDNDEALKAQKKADWAGFSSPENQQRELEKQEETEKEKRDKIAEVSNKTGNLLGKVPLGYVGGFDPKYKSNAGDSSSEGTLYCYEKVIYYEKRKNSFTILSSNIVSFEVGGRQQTTSRLSVTRMVALGVFSLAAPKRTTVKDTSVIIGLKDGRQIFFHTTTSTEFDIHLELANAISYYRSLQVSQAGQQPSSQTHPTDNANEIMKYATLRKRGVITEEEFEAKKKQLLGL